MKLTRHAHNRMRLYRIAPADVHRVLANPDSRGLDERGNPVFAGSTTDGRTIQVVVAADDPDLVITTLLTDHAS